MRSSAIWISWHISRRSLGISTRLAVPFVGLQIERHPLIRHVVSAVWTLWQLARLRPKVLFVQHSFLLTAILAACAKLSAGRIALYVDIHSKALHRDVSGYVGHVFRWVRAWSFQQVAAVVVANEAMGASARKLCAVVFVLPDPLPRPPRVTPVRATTHYLVYPASYDSDEPWNELLAAAKDIPHVPIYCTGRSTFLTSARVDLPANIYLTGWLDEDAYWSLLMGSTAVLALTKSEGTTQCAASEALSIGAPVILTRTAVLVEEFGHAAVYVDKNLRDLSVAVEQLIDKRATLREKLAELAKLRDARFDAALQRVVDFTGCGNGFD